MATVIDFSFVADRRHAGGGLELHGGSRIRRLPPFFGGRAHPSDVLAVRVPERADR
jgi:hypothetical protein